MEKPNNKHGIPNEVYSSWLDTATQAYKEQGNLTGAAQFTHNDTTYVVRKKGNYKNGNPRFAITPKSAKKATQTERDKGLKSKPLTKEQRAESIAKQQAIRGAGQIPDHINEQWIINQTRENSTPEEWERIKATYPMGQEAENIQPLNTQSENTQKTTDWKKLQRSLGKAEAARLIRNAAPVALSIPAGIAASTMSAQAAIQDPSQDNLVNAGFDVANTLADLVGLIPTPLTIGASEAAQRAIMMGQMSYNATRQISNITPGFEKFVPTQRPKPAQPYTPSIIPPTTDFTSKSSPAAYTTPGLNEFLKGI